MSRVSLPVGRLAALVAVAGIAYTVARGTNELHWRALAPGVEFTTVRGEPFCRRGSSDIAVLRLDPRRVVLQMLHATREPGHQPLTIVEWQRRTGAFAVFNAGQYYPDYSYMGLLVCDGEVVSRRLHPNFKAALVAAPVSGASVARVLDLEHDPIDPKAPGWKQVAQSFMLFGRDGETRVRKSDQVANRTIVAEDRRGRLLVITSEGGYTLWDFAELLKRSPLQLTHAMSMDGGYEAELCVAAKGFRYASFGRWKSEDDESAPGAQVPLPAVVAVRLQ
ncbi:MAG TPA: phosphodiester glycosidase family protein [Candidatus Limnocylindria bacterium]|nr:phosphodiester glycosidase family protein [Candidatus Limnocylindria bacterium]